MPKLKRTPAVPHGLSERAQKIWPRLARSCVALGTLTDVDGPALEMLAEIMATGATALELIQRDGLVSTTAAGGAKTHPAIRVLEKARAQAHALMADFGLTPKARESLEIRDEWEHPEDFEGDDE
jgi:P27 family predicted phage terminase small subunit